MAALIFFGGEKEEAQIHENVRNKTRYIPVIMLFGDTVALVVAH